MNFYQILLAQKVNGVNRNLTWYDNLFARFYNGAFVKLIAKFLKIKGNTLVWNQLVQNGNFADTSNWNKHQASTPTFSVSNNEATILASAKGGGIYNSKISVTNGHKYYISVMLKGTSSFEANLVANMTSQVYHLVNVTTSYSRFSFLQQANSTSATGIVQITDNREIGFDNFYAKNVIVLDLTLMGIDNLTTTAEVEAWLSSHIGNLPYYVYTPGKLLPFKGESLKTTGKNQVDVNNLALNEANNRRALINMPDTINDLSNYVLKWNNSNYQIALTLRDLSRKPSSSGDNTPPGVYDSSWRTSPFSVNLAVRGWFSLIIKRTDNDVITETDLNNIKNMNIMLTKTNDTSIAYEPYASNTLSLPTLDYFPTGMKSAGSVYDEITESKAITRVGSYTFKGNETISASADLGTYYRIEIPYQSITPDVKISSQGYVTIAISDFAPFDGGYTTDSLHFYYYNGSWRIYIPVSSDAEALVYLTGKTMYYELATPTETTIDPPLDLSYPIEWGGTEQLLPENTSVPTTSPILADMHYPDGDRADQMFTYRQINKELVNKNNALSTMLGRNVWTDEPDEPLDILLKGE